MTDNSLENYVGLEKQASDGIARNVFMGWVGNSGSYRIP